MFVSCGSYPGWGPSAKTPAREPGSTRPTGRQTPRRSPGAFREWGARDGACGGLWDAHAGLCPRRVRGTTAAGRSTGPGTAVAQMRPVPHGRSSPGPGRGPCCPWAFTPPSHPQHHLLCRLQARALLCAFQALPSAPGREPGVELAPDTSVSAPVRANKSACQFQGRWWTTGLGSKEKGFMPRSTSSDRSVVFP